MCVLNVTYPVAIAFLSHQLKKIFDQINTVVLVRILELYKLRLVFFNRSPLTKDTSGDRSFLFSKSSSILGKINLVRKQVIQEIAELLELDVELITKSLREQSQQLRASLAIIERILL
ncbi:MAG: hypothetical protein RMY28_008125 [Nostoc sp. ChiSLP01]|nr:hypothetical protein [Nostoc sp. CmiSLP01]MDZ8284694.1 hypothetical protein [Nostoc sp. ChiSLP01]